MGRAKLELKGFDEFYEKLQKVSDNVDEVAEKKFNECVDILENELRTKAQAAGLAPRLLKQITKDTHIGKGYWRGEVGWKSSKQKNPLSDFYKVVFWNYGTPTRTVKKENVKNQLDGNWTTLGKNRGSIMKHGFIKRAKLAASRKIKTLMKNTMKEMLNK